MGKGNSLKINFSHSLKAFEIEMKLVSLHLNTKAREALMLYTQLFFLKILIQNQSSHPAKGHRNCQTNHSPSFCLNKMSLTMQEGPVASEGVGGIARGGLV